MAKALADYFFGHGKEPGTGQADGGPAGGDRLIRLDMSEYAGPGAAGRLLGHRTREPGPLIKRIRRQPFSVVLLDEIEKADPEVFDLLLDVMDEGRLTDPFGRLTFFRSAILIMTSNLGADKQGGFGFGKGAGPSYDAEVASFFRLEFVNRLDAVIVFRPLDAEMIRRITEKELAELQAREGLARRGLTLAWSPALVEHLSRTGFDHRYGARPLQRELERVVVTPLARFLAEHPRAHGRRIALDCADGRAIFTLAP